jgi:hypothetical protein
MSSSTECSVFTAGLSRTASAAPSSPRLTLGPNSPQKIHRGMIFDSPTSGTSPVSVTIAVAGAPSLAGGPPQARLRKMRIVAQDPSVTLDGRRGSILTAEVDVPAEELAPGPRGYRVHVIDYDASSGLLYAPLEYGAPDPGSSDWLRN